MEDLTDKQLADLRMLLSRNTSKPESSLERLAGIALFLIGSFVDEEIGARMKARGGADAE